MTTDAKAIPAPSTAPSVESPAESPKASPVASPVPPPRPAAKPAPTPAAARARPVAKPATVKKRHLGLILSFAFMVLVPASLSALYLYIRGVDQYASTLGFTVRSEDISSASDLLGGLSSTLGGSGSRDTDILYEYIRSQEIVAAIDADLDLHAIYSRHYDTDPLLSFDPEGTIEDLTDYWQRMVRISYDAGAGLMDLRVLAFTPEDARDIAQAIYDESLRTINALSAIAREDATRYAREDLETAIERLKVTREAITAFRIESQIVDVTADIQGQMGLLSTLQAQLAEALIEFDLLSLTVRDDPRLTQAQRRIDVIEARITEERRKFGASGQSPSGESYADTVATFERLTVDREVAERTYVAALSGYDAAVAEANRQSLYLAAYIRPTLAQKSEFPQRELLIGIVALFSFLLWSILSLVYYSLRDRR
jgi:capsular polysaccharide transport system permease protein